MKNIYITSAIRTAVGSLGKSLKNIPSDELGSAVIKSAITKSGISESVIDEVIMGQVLTAATGQNAARQASVNAGINKETFFANLRFKNLTLICGDSTNKDTVKKAF